MLLSIPFVLSSILPQTRIVIVFLLGNKKMYFSISCSKFLGSKIFFPHSEFQDAIFNPFLMYFEIKPLNLDF